MVRKVLAEAATRATMLRLANPWPGRAVKAVIDGNARTLSASEIIEVSLKKGQTALLAPTGKEQ